MIRSSAVIFIIILICISCTRTNQRNLRYDASACPICINITNGACSYCNGTKKCMYCKGLKERRVVSPNLSSEIIKPFEYKEPCPYCKGNGICNYCSGTGKCWACGGTTKVSPEWKCLKEKTAAAQKHEQVENAQEAH